MIKLLSLFSGIGAFETALKRGGLDYDLVAYCDIDKYASKSYSAIHGVSEELNLWDVTKIDTSTLPKDIDLITYGFPCQSISLAGKMDGLFHEDGSLTRSGLFFEALRIIKDTQPKVAIAENVKNLTGKKFKEQFELVLQSLEDAGYKNYWKVLNSKDYGIPQNRERVFIISIRKDIEQEYTFPEPFPLTLRLKDMLDDKVDEKYYLSDDKIKSISNWKAQQKPFEHVNGAESISPTLTARGAGLEHSGMVLYGDGLQETTNLQPSLEIKEATKKGYAEATVGDSINLEQPNSQTRRGRVGKGVAQTITTQPNQAVMDPSIEVMGNNSPSGHDASRIVSENGIAPTVKENHGTVTAIAKCVGGIGEPKSNGGKQYYQQHRVYQGDIALSHPASLPTVSYNYAIEEKATAVAMRGREDGQQIEPSDREYDNAITTVQKDSMVMNNIRIRKLTPKECWRLQGFNDDEFAKAEQVVSDSQLYKQAGNSITVNVLEEIFKNLKGILY